jgi:hypothetical protein
VNVFWEIIEEVVDCIVGIEEMAMRLDRQYTLSFVMA